MLLAAAISLAPGSCAHILLEMGRLHPTGHLPILLFKETQPTSENLGMCKLQFELAQPHKQALLGFASFGFPSTASLVSL